jgi:hypothetical protein
MSRCVKDVRGRPSATHSANLSMNTPAQARASHALINSIQIKSNQIKLNARPTARQQRMRAPQSLPLFCCGTAASELCICQPLVSSGEPVRAAHSSRR